MLALGTRARLILVCLTALARPVFAEAAKPDDASVLSREFESKPIQLDRIYRSMQGPTDERIVTLEETGPRRLLWITGLDVDPLAEDGTVLDDGQQFICHVNVSHPDRERWARELVTRRRDGRAVPFNWFTLVQGHYSIDFPRGFAMPAYSDQPLRILWMAQNQDPTRKPFAMRIRSRVRFLEDARLTAPMVPLNKFSWDIRVAQPYHSPPTPASTAAQDAEHRCENDETDSPPSAAANSNQDAVLHFAVPPGRHTYRASFRGDSKIPFDTTAHHISAHLHVYGESLELIDLSAGKSIFVSKATSNAARTGIVRMTDYSSSTGIPLFRDHRYELVAVYDNTTDQPIDAMAVIYIYYRDKPVRL